MSMTESEGKKLEGLARSIDALFTGERTEASAPEPAPEVPELPEPELIDVTGVDFTTEPVEGDRDSSWLLEPVGDGDDPPGGDLDLSTAGSLDLSSAGPLEFGLGGDLDLDAAPEAMPDEIGPVDIPDPVPPEVEVELEATPPALPDVEVELEATPPPLPDVEVELEATPPPLPEVEVELEATPPPLPDVEVELEATPPPLPEVEVEAAPPPVPEAPPAPMETELGLAGIGSTEPPVEPALAATGMFTAVEVDSDGDGQDFVPTALDEAVDAYLSGDDARSDEVKELTADFASRQDLDPIARAAERIVLAAGDPPDPNLLGVARSIVSPRVLEQIVRRMGTERSEERRTEYYAICAGLGTDLAEAIKNALGETTTDRLARRIYCEALTEMGPTGRRMIESMVDDENQFIVRNAISILGDTGGSNAVPLVTSALANSDRRVRREALKSLAKLGDTESGDVVLGLLDDSDEEVRVQAAVTAGELQVSRALRPILKMLDDAKDQDEALPFIRALGHIGDPGAVNSIEKYAVPGLLRRSRTDVRIAAYRALHQIGTPHAKQVLLAVAKDKDEEVKDAVKGMLYG